MYTYQQRLEYAKRLQRLQQAVVIKDNIHLTYKYKNRNKAYAHIDSVQDRINKAIIEEAVNGNADSIKNLEKQGEKLIADTLTNERKRLHSDKNHKAINQATKSNSNYFSNIFNYRRKKIGESLEDKINKELKKKSVVDLSDEEQIQHLQSKFKGHGSQRLKNILTDAMHTNESNIGFIKAIEDGFNYKVWKNGRVAKGRTRVWHKEKHIQAVPIDETFDIYGSYPAHMMYPGDLNGGAENVANCRCWLLYTNKIPTNLRKKTTFNVNSEVFIKNNSQSITSKIKSKFKQIKSSINKKKNNFLSRLNKKYVENLKKEYYDYTKEFSKNANKTRKKLQNEYPIPNLDVIEEHFIVEWGMDSGPLNRYLRKIDKVSESQKKFFSSYIQRLNKGINKYNNIQHNTLLHRRVSSDFFIEDVGKIGKFETPISTSFNDHAIKKKNYGDFHISILAPKDVNGAYLEEIMKKHHGINHNHEEWLLPINSKYKTLYKNYETKEAVIILLT